MPRKYIHNGWIIWPRTVIAETDPRRRSEVFIRFGPFLAPLLHRRQNRDMIWRPVSEDMPEGAPILVACGDQAVVALAFPGDYYFPDMTFMDARTFDILPTPSHWARIEPLPSSGLGGHAAECRQAA